MVQQWSTQAILSLSSRYFIDNTNFSSPKRYKLWQEMSVGWVDIVFDVYRDATLKQDTRDWRDTDGMLISITMDAPMQHKFLKKILTMSENKTKLFQLVSDSVISQYNQGTIVCTKGSGVVANTPMLAEHLQPCNQEEADT